MLPLVAVSVVRSIATHSRMETS
jgi:hypothetical protein